MRRIVLVIVLVAVLAVAGYLLLRPRRAPARSRSRTATTDTTDDAGTVRSRGSRTARTGRAVGKLKTSTAAERRAEAKKIRDAERKRKKELRRQEREKKRMLRRAASRRGRRTSRKGGGYYILKAIVAAGGQSYALVDGRKVQAGDFVLGRKIIEIGQDRIEIEAFGRRSTVRVGQSLMPSSYTPTGR
jgi:hypothetical protein